ncbi:MAG: patatin-like phospholipase family protein [Bacteroidales bacterium]|nr:patatin-like phospholipase family protein [Bacteroidales bacterium]
MGDKKKLGVVLSGGGARGFAHLGLLQVLEEMKVRPEVIAGTSAGAIAAAFYADGYKPKEIVDILMERSFIRYAELSLPRSGGIMRLTGIKSLLEKKLKSKNIEDLEIPVIICATNMNTGESVFFSKGALVERVLASASIPVIFQLIDIDGFQYADGGVLNNMPVEPIKDKVDVILGVNVTAPSEKKDLHSVFEIAERSFHLSISANVNIQARLCDYYIEMPELMEYSLLKSSHGKEIFDVGYMKAKQYFKNHPLNLD